MEFIFAKQGECNLHMVREFYTNWALDARSHFVTMWGVDVSLTPAVINDIVGTSQDTDTLVLIRLNIRPPNKAIQHTLCGPQSMVEWTKHNGKRYHQSLPYTHTLREMRVWLKVVINFLILGLHYTDITQDRVCLVYALMTPTELNIGVVLKSAMRKAQVHKGHIYAFGSLITRMCRVAGVPEENVDYMAPLFPAPMDITRTKGPDTKFGPTLTTAEPHKRDELIMANMYGLEMLHHQNGCLASTDMQLSDVERHYPLNAHAKALLGIGPAFREPIDDCIPIDEERLGTSSDVDPAQAGVEAEGGDAMED
ncbi:hypothetical protein H5410_026864 [Solanum commersonii]|uniref:Putative plant transposon protein domain-containing protein n=1 Tax=Solanum commersonii TaxID=4109 RepID=A0A9J5Z1V4_SOLCO|nr:hypothetical protein H5410_026864 [Solanum commersonii]